ncbi:unnamed protein product, partial [marine sediment metagenome]
MEKDITEKFTNVFEKAITEDGSIISGVAVFGNRTSKNRRRYSEQAMNDLEAKTSGTKAFINHISKS